MFLESHQVGAGGVHKIYTSSSQCQCWVRGLTANVPQYTKFCCYLLHSHIPLCWGKISRSHQDEVSRVYLAQTDKDLTMWRGGCALVGCTREIFHYPRVNQISLLQILLGAQSQHPGLPGIGRGGDANQAWGKLRGVALFQDSVSDSALTLAE